MITMAYTINNIDTSIEVLIDLKHTSKTMYEVLDYIGQVRATSRYKEIYLHSESSQILGVLA